MQIVRAVAGMGRLSFGWRKRNRRVALVPTMGYLHEGHLSLIRRARKLVGRGGIVVVSIYVNPAQFGPREDFSKYPRDFRHDARVCRDAKVDVIFAPKDGEMYPAGQGKDGEAFSTYVVEEYLSRGMEGASRPTHFRGVTTVVAKLFNIVWPEFAVFGAKDYQQAAIVQRMVRDLNFPLKVVVATTLRESDGLAMSSRNKYLTGNLRNEAVVLWLAIQRAQALVRASKNIAVAALRSDLRRFVSKMPSARVDYIEFFDSRTLQPVKSVNKGAHMALAVFIGEKRLIDNAVLG